MKALCLAGSTVTLLDRTPTVVREGEELVRLRLGGICGTDLELAKGYMGFEGVLGHELLGTTNGRRVVAEINAACGRCTDCRRGLATHCPTRTVLGILGRDGALQELVSIPRACLHAVPDAVPDDHAVFVEPLAAAAHLLDDAPVRAGDRAAVVGDGKLGLLCALVLRWAGARVLLVGHHARHLAIAESQGVEVVLERDVTARRAFELVVDATGHPAGLARALSLIRPRGTLVLKSTFAAKEGVDLAPIVIDEVKVVGSRCGPFPRALELLAARAIDPTPLIDARYPLARADEAFAQARRGGALKVLVEG